jgi:two-component system, OmpR family, response regulator
MGTPTELLDFVAYVLTGEQHQVRILEVPEFTLGKIKYHGPDLIILDTASAGLNSLRICETLRARRAFARIPILLLAAGQNSNPSNSHVGGTLPRPLEPKLLVTRVKELLHAEAKEALRTKICAGSLVIDPSTYTATDNGRPVNLTPLEFRLLYYLASRSNVACRRDELLRAVWDDPRIGWRAVDAAIRHLREKIEDSADEPVRIRSARGNGYFFHLPEPPRS